MTGRFGENRRDPAPNARTFLIAPAVGRVERRRRPRQILAQALECGREQRALVAKIAVERAVRETGFHANRSGGYGGIGLTLREPFERFE